MSQLSIPQRLKVAKATGSAMILSKEHVQIVDAAFDQLREGSIRAGAADYALFKADIDATRRKMRRDGLLAAFLLGLLAALGLVAAVLG